MKNIKHIFFDLDDTLWDFESNSSLVLSDLFIKYNLKNFLNTNLDNFHSTYKIVNAELWQAYGSKKITKEYLRNNRFNLSFNNFGYDNYDLNIKVTEDYLKLSPLGKTLVPNALDVLNYLKHNYELHIITNGFKEVQEIKLNNCDIKHFFKTIIISEEHQLSKPDIKIFELAENLAKAKKEECVMIGDNFESDIMGAINAGWQAIWLTYENERKDLISINNLLDLRSLL